jgi:short subunit dehydrogenase-like uncharacterized protein
VSREFDIVLFGATGFTGQLVAQQLAAMGGLHWAIAGRNRDKLTAVAAELPTGSAPALELADAHDRASLDALVARTRVVVSTVGPYAQHGSDLVAACAGAGTHYCDLTGEAHWVRAMIDAHHATAQQSGARIVHCCGFDSIPGDLSVWLLQHELQQRGRSPALHVRGYYHDLRGGVSGGTVASMRGIVQAATTDKGLRRLLVDPYALVPARAGEARQHELGFAIHRDQSVVTAPFVMAGINTRVVYRSNALADDAYGREFTYHEALAFPLNRRGIADAMAMTAGVTALPVAMAAAMAAATKLPPLAKLLDNKLPKAGEGPSERARTRGHYTLKVRSVDSDAPTVTFHDDADPGYGSTSKMLASAAACLAFDALDSKPGVLTPAVAMGQALIDRLRNAGLTITVE